MSDTDDLAQRSIQTIRFLAVDAVERANSGHAGLPMGAASMAYVLFTRHLRMNPANPAWPDRDRFILSAGHGSMLLYALLHLTGYDLPLEELKRFRQWGSRTPGHPEYGHTPGVETTTGPLGQGFANGVGMAMAEAHLAAMFNRPGHPVVNHRTYAIVSDGDLMEGVASEAASLAGHLKLGRLIYLYDCNRISIEGSTALAFTEDVAARFSAYGWQVVDVPDGDDLAAVDRALEECEADEGRPSLIVAHTHIGYGSPHKQDTAAAHANPLGPDEVRLTKEAAHWPLEPEFYVPDDVRAHFRTALARGEALEREWNERVAAYTRAHPELGEQLTLALRGEVPQDLAARLPRFAPGQSLATRSASGQVLNALAPALPTLFGGSADLSPSNDTELKGLGSFEPDSPAGPNIHFGVREHAMGAALNGMALHGGVIPYGATFLVFSDYERPAIRLAALSRIPSVFVFTHDSVAVGEDGPTHEPVEHLMALRAIPGLTVIRPADAGETAVAWQTVIEGRRPAALILTRQKVPVLDASLGSPRGLAKGGYVLKDPAGVPELILIGTGSEVHLALAAAETLEAEGIAVRVVSLPSWELFQAQSQSYRDEVLPPGVRARVSVEAGVTLGWSQWVGDAGAAVGIDRFGASAPGDEVMRRLGMTVERVVGAAREVLARTSERSVSR